MEIDPVHRAPAENYKLITGLIVPRPTAWITSVTPVGHQSRAIFRLRARDAQADRC